MEVVLLSGSATARVHYSKLPPVADKRWYQPPSFALTHAGYFQFGKLFSFWIMFVLSWNTMSLLNWFEERWHLPEKLQWAEPCIIDEGKLSFPQRPIEVYRLDVKCIETANTLEIFHLAFFFTFSNIHRDIYIYVCIWTHTIYSCSEHIRFLLISSELSLLICSSSKDLWHI